MNKWAAAIVALLAVPASAQDFSQRGYLEFRGFAFPDTVPHDRAHGVGEAIFRYEIEQSIVKYLRLSGATETRIDTHHQTERRFFVNWSDRTPQRPAFSIRRLSFLYNRGRFTAEVGKQHVRWGKADILNPTDRFTPRDFLAVVDTEFLAIGAARLIYEGKSNSLEVVVQPRFTPSRTPLPNQRWTVLPPALNNVPVRDLGARLPGGPNLGVRWNHLGRGFETSLSFFEGHHHLPLIEGAFRPAAGLEFIRVYPQLRSYGADAAIPLKPFTLRTEAAYFTTTSANADEYVIYVVQAERQVGEFLLLGGYAGEWVTDRRNPFQFAPDRGLAKSFLGRASYTLDAKRSVALEYAIRQNGEGVWLRSEYSHLLGQSWRVTTGFTAIRGDLSDFLGQYRRNSHAFLTLRYSF